MMNPETYSLDYKVEYQEGQGQGTSAAQQRFTVKKPEEFSFEFLFDNTGIIDENPRDDLIDDPRYATGTARKQRARELNDMVRDWASQRTRQDVWDGLRDLGYFGGPVLSMSEVLEDPHLKERGAFMEQAHPIAGATTLVAPWIELSATPASVERPAPGLGEHTDEVLERVLELTTDRLRALREEGAIA